MQVIHPTTFDRRSPNRRPLPPCPRCHERAAAVMERTPSFLYCECPSCNKMWSVPKAALQMQPSDR